MKKIIVYILLAALPMTAKPQTPLLVAPHFEAKDFNGNPHELYTYLNAGKYVLLDFFTTTCGTCSTYNPHVNAVYQSYGCNTGNLIVLGINWGSTNSLLAQYHQSNGLGFPALSGLEGYGNEITQTYQIASFISVLLIAPNRNIVEQYIYPPSFSALSAVLSSYGLNAVQCLVGTGPSISPFPDNIRVYPNPAVSKVYIQNKDDSSPIKLLAIFDVSGRMVWKTGDITFDTLNGTASVSLTGISPGNYVLRFTLADGGTIHSKLIILPGN